MAIPYTNRSATFEIPDLALQLLSEEKVILSSNAVIDDIAAQFADIVSHVECITQISAKGFRATFKTAQSLEEAMHSGVTFRAFPLAFQPVSTYRWVTVRRLPYGIPGEEIVRALAPYGKVIKVKSELHKGVYNGHRSALMDLDRDIASLVRIKGHNCQIFYRGQPRTCFRCGKQGHESKACPGRAVEVQVRDNDNIVKSKKRPYNEVLNGSPSTSTAKVGRTLASLSKDRDSEDEYESSHEEAPSQDKTANKDMLVDDEPKNQGSPVDPKDRLLPANKEMLVDDEPKNKGSPVDPKDKVVPTDKMVTLVDDNSKMVVEGSVTGNKGSLVPPSQVIFPEVHGMSSDEESSDSEADIADEAVDSADDKDMPAKVSVNSATHDKDMPAKVSVNSATPQVSVSSATPNVGAQSISVKPATPPATLVSASALDTPNVGAQSRVPVFKGLVPASLLGAQSKDIGAQSKDIPLVYDVVIPDRVRTRPRLPYSGGEKMKISGLTSTPQQPLLCTRRGTKPKAPSGDL